MMTTAAIMMIAVRLVLMMPWIEVSGFCASGQKMSVIDLKPATRVVVLTNASGTIVTHAYRALPGVDHDRRRHAQSHRGQQLIGNAKHRPDRRN